MPKSNDTDGPRNQIFTASYQAPGASSRDGPSRSFESPEFDTLLASL